MLKIILFGILILLVLCAIIYYLFISTGIKLPKETDAIVNEVLQSKNLPKLVGNDTGFAENDGVKIWYEKMTPSNSPKGTILLVMGYNSTALVWSPNFTQPLLDAGYQIIRYDNRGVGESDWMPNWTKKNRYTLEDMAKDGMAVLAAAGVKKAHIIGASMGGMIAQRMAISHAEKVLSLTSIMSTGYMDAPNVPSVSSANMRDFVRLTLRHLVPSSDEEGELKFMIGVQQLLRGNGPYEPSIRTSAERTLYEIRHRKGRNPKGGNQHGAAIKASGSRLNELSQIKVPTLIIHGKSDPLVRFEHCEKYTPLIPHAKKLFIDGMGHDLPDLYMPQIHAAILDNVSA